jgi:hypothetical protein
MVMKKNKFVYLVYCNTEPIVYGVYSKKQSAVRYAIDLIRHRKQRAKEKGHQFGYYHFLPLMQPSQIRWGNDSDSPYYHDLLVLSACLMIKDGAKDYSDDGCYVKVVRKVLNP